MYVTSHYCFVSSSSLSSSVCVSSLSSSYLIYRRMRVMPNLCDYYHSLSINSRVLTKRKEINMPYLVRLGFFSLSCRWLFDNNNIDYNKRVITTSIRNIGRKKEEEKERNRNRIESFSGIHSLCHHMAWLCIYVCVPMYGFIEPNKQKHIRYHKWLINRINW